MVSVYFTELKRYKFEEIKKEIDNARKDISTNREEVKYMIQKLKECQIIKAISSISSVQNISVNNSEEALGETISDDVFFVFAYVGIIVLGDYVIKCLPKYILSPTDEPENKFKEVVRVIEKYNRIHAPKKRYFNLADGRGGVISNEIALKVFLLREYYQRGLYKKDRETVEDDGAGEILWEETLETPGFYKDEKIFHIPLKTIRVDDDDNYFTDLHRSILTEISKEFDKNKLLDIFNISPVFLTNLSLKQFDKTEHIKYMLKREIKVQFVTWKQNLLCALYAYVCKEKTKSISDRIELFGTNCFNLVWEDVCKNIFVNQLNCKLKDLPGYSAKNAGVDIYKKLSDVIERPVWRSYSGTKYIADRTFEPDIIGIFPKKDDQDKFELWILDAKYYVFDWINGKTTIKNQPGVEDIAKQYLYELVFKNLILKNFSDPYKYDFTYNVFLCPSDSAKTEIFGCAEIESLKDMIEVSLESVSVVKLDVREMYKIYLDESINKDCTKLLENLRDGLRSFYESA